MIAYVRMVDGSFRKHGRILAMQNGTEADIDDIGFFRPGDDRACRAWRPATSAT